MHEEKNKFNSSLCVLRELRGKIELCPKNEDVRYKTRLLIKHYLAFQPYLCTIQSNGRVVSPPAHDLGLYDRQAR